MKADGSDRRVLTESLDRQCAPFPLAREPVWDGDRVAFGVEDGGNVHLYAVAADGSGEPELLVGGEQSTGLYDLVDGVLVYTASTHDRPHELFSGDGRADHVRLRRLRRGAGARRRRAVHGQLRRRDRGRRVARAPSRLRRGEALPDAPHDPRRPVLAIRDRLLRRGAGVRGRRLLRPLLEPARRLRLLRGVGTRDPRHGQRRRPRLGLGRLRGRHGRRRHGARAVSASSTRIGSASSAAPTAAS